MKINYATTFDSKDIHLWSGLGYYIGKMLHDQGHEVNYLNELRIHDAMFHKARKHLLRRVFQKVYSPNFSLRVARQYNREISKKLEPGSLIFTPNTILLSHLEGQYKKVLYTDATFRLLLNFYPAFTNILPKYIDQAEEIERRALTQADLLIYSSSWAANSAIKDYGADPARIGVVPFGANIDLKMQDNELTQLVNNRVGLKEVNLLLVAVSWYRKGGDYALDVVRKLNASGVPARLHIAGLSSLPSGLDLRYVTNHGYISKGTTQGQAKIVELMKKVNFMLLPSRADCTPVAVSEANSFGLPCLLSTVGGNHSVVTGGVNGDLFNFYTGTDDCVEYIRSMRKDADSYAKLCYSSYDRYVSELNWNESGKKITSLLQGLLQ